MKIDKESYIPEWSISKKNKKAKLPFKTQPQKAQPVCNKRLAGKHFFMLKNGIKIVKI